MANNNNNVTRPSLALHGNGSGETELAILLTANKVWPSQTANVQQNVSQLKFVENKNVAEIIMSVIVRFW